MDEVLVVGETAEGATIRLRKVFVEGLDGEALVDEEGNVYDMEGHYIGEIEEDDIPNELQALPEFQQMLKIGKEKAIGLDVNLN